MQLKTALVRVLAAMLAISAVAGTPRVVLSSDENVPAFATKAQLDLYQKTEAEFNANNDPDKEVALKQALAASASDYMLTPRTTVKLLKVIKNGGNISTIA
jgi:hypothetical protein